MSMLSVIVPSLTGTVPESLRRLARDRPEIDLVVVSGVSPVGKARNEGLRRATGDYIAWVDADDEVTDDWWPKVREGMRGGLDLLVLDYTTSEGRAVAWQESGRGVLFDLLDERLSSGCWRYVTRRALWVDLSFDERAAMAEDYRLMPEIVARAKSVGRLGNIYRYYINPDGLMRDYANRAHVRARFQAGAERAVRWRGTVFEDVAFAASCRQAGWMYEWHEYEPEIAAYLKRNLVRALRCPDLAWHWKVKMVLIRLGLVRILKPLYRGLKLLYVLPQ